MSLGFHQLDQTVMEEAGFTRRTEQRGPDTSTTAVIMRPSLSFKGQELHVDS